MKHHVEFDLELKKNPYPGKFIVIEGIDAAGKSTHVNLLGEHLTTDHKVHVTKNPTNSEIGQLIRKVLVKDVPATIVAIQYLFAADRDNQQSEIIEHLKNGEIVISDRYYWSALAYGLADKDHVDFEHDEHTFLVAMGILSMYHQFIVPDLSIYIDISVQTAMERLGQIHQRKEVYENSETLKRVEGGYRWVLNNFKENFVVVSGEKSIEEVEKNIETEVEKLLKA